MTSLLEIGPLTDEVTVRGQQVTVYPATALSIFYLLDAFPDIRAMWSEGKITAASLMERLKKLSPDYLMEMAPNTVATVLAIATTEPPDIGKAPVRVLAKWKAEIHEAAKVARYLSLPDQIAILETLFELTFPEGVGPFVKQLEALTARMRASGPDQDTQSQETLSASLEMDIPGNKHGPIRLAS